MNTIKNFDFSAFFSRKVLTGATVLCKIGQQGEWIMAIEGKMDESTIRIIVEQFNKSIEEHKKEIIRLEKAKSDFLLSDSTPKSRTQTKKRLPIGAPKKFAINAFIELNKPVTVSDLTEKIEKQTGHKLSSSTIRRALIKLEQERKIVKRDDGFYVFKGIIARAKNTSETPVNDDDLPF